jgi:hypothetical protein
MDCLFVIEKKEKLAGKHRKQKNSLLTEIRILDSNADLLCATGSPYSPMTVKT